MPGGLGARAGPASRSGRPRRLVGPSAHSIARSTRLSPLVRARSRIVRQMSVAGMASMRTRSHRSRSVLVWTDDPVAPVLGAPRDADLGMPRPIAGDPVEGGSGVVRRQRPPARAQERSEHAGLPARWRADEPEHASVNGLPASAPHAVVRGCRRLRRAARTSARRHQPVLAANTGSRASSIARHRIAPRLEHRHMAGEVRLTLGAREPPDTPRSARPSVRNLSPQVASRGAWR